MRRRTTTTTRKGRTSYKKTTDRNETSDCGSEISRSSSCFFCCSSSSSIVFLWSSWVLQSPLGFIWIRFNPWESPGELSWIREAHKSKSNKLSSVKLKSSLMKLQATQVPQDLNKPKNRNAGHTHRETHREDPNVPTESERSTRPPNGLSIHQRRGWGDFGASQIPEEDGCRSKFRGSPTRGDPKSLDRSTTVTNTREAKQVVLLLQRMWGVWCFSPGVPNFRNAARIRKNYCMREERTLRS